MKSFFRLDIIGFETPALAVWTKLGRFLRYYHVQQIRTLVQQNRTQNYYINRLMPALHQPVYVVILCSILLDECSNLLDMIVS